MSEAPGYIEVAVNRPIDRLFHYRVPEPQVAQVRLGHRVRVPFGRGQATGVCVGIVDRPDRPTRDILGTLDPEPLFDDEILRLSRWMAAYYRASWGEVLEAAIPPGVKAHRRDRLRRRVVPRLPPDELEALAKSLAVKAPAQARLIRRIAARGGDGVAEGMVLKEAQTGRETLRRLLQEGVVALEAEPPAGDPFHDLPSVPGSPVELSLEQLQAISRIEGAIAGGSFRPFLIHGVTGSGKTEVYLKALEEVIRRGRQGLVLLPEISLTPQAVRRYRDRLGKILVLHSMLSERDRASAWRAIRQGEGDVVVGVRSAIFAPVRRLGLIVVDEEHESSYKQETSPRYHARDVAVVRAKQLGIPILLGSATPSLESYHNARVGKYELIELTHRVTPHDLPHVMVVSLTRTSRRRGSLWFSEELESLIANRLERGEQTFLFLNRRGFAHFLYCPRCGFVLRCTDCDIALTYHKQEEAVRCHYCGGARRPPETCPTCGSPGMRPVGAGTERIAEGVAERFPEARIGRLDRDTARSHERLKRILRSLWDGKIDILVGTQMIAKGHDFPNVTLVGIILADSSLHLPDFRAAERTFQLITQVAGRAGRGERRGRVVVQTLSPDHFAVQCAAQGDYRTFFETEWGHRSGLGYPPLGRIAKLLVEGKDGKRVASRAQEIGVKLRGAPTSWRVLGPSPAPISRIQGRTRYQILVKAPDPGSIQAALERIHADANSRGTERVVVDVDPISML